MQVALNGTGESSCVFLLVCRVMGPEHALVAKQWATTRHTDDEEHFFAVLDFADGQEIYQRVSPFGGAHLPAADFPDSSLTSFILRN